MGEGGDVASGTPAMAALIAVSAPGRGLSR